MRETAVWDGDDDNEPEEPESRPSIPYWTEQALLDFERSLDDFLREQRKVASMLEELDHLPPVIPDSGVGQGLLKESKGKMRFLKWGFSMIAGLTIAGMIRRKILRC